MIQKVRVSIPGSPIYVSGTVNSVPVVWTLVQENTWEAEANKSADGIYKVSIAAIDSMGNATNTELTLYEGVLALITDRKSSDVGRNEKGYYNATDLNRVGHAIDYLKDRLYDTGYSVEVSPKKDWTMEDIPSKAQMEHYLEDINTIKSMLTRINGEAPEPPDTMRFLRWNEANDIEQILVNMEENLNRIPPAYFYSNEIFAGELY